MSLDDFGQCIVLLSILPYFLGLFEVLPGTHNVLLTLFDALLCWTVNTDLLAVNVQYTRQISTTFKNIVKGAERGIGQW